MRFIDKILKDPSVDPNLKNDGLDGAVIIDCSPVAEYFFAGTDQEIWTLKDFPFLAPPYEHFWLDFQAPSEIVSEVHGTKAWEGPSDWGFVCGAIEINQENADDFLWHMGKHADLMRSLVPQAKWGIQMYMYWKIHGFIHGPIWCWTFLADKDGKCLQKEDKYVIFAVPLDHDIQWAFDVQYGKEEAPERMEKFIWPYWCTALLSLSFLHCKNVRLVDVDPGKRPTHNKSAKRRKERETYHPVPYKVLDIEPMKEIFRTKGRSAQVGTKKALHICRGYFADYTQGAGLFGKWHDSYWFNPKVRGTVQRGVTTKDYKIKV